ncbi:Rpn family recombination-promoting nuclease/putative transposase [Scytonema sp. NUACC26]|uniref:Rpn family recombination-promoting nuclease/putative transposase n=1 Tax=Scytonema sp. NUACC26 TaxID=3140176 RepID=UPI0034DB8C73
MFDNICKFLVESFSTDFATWLLGEPIALTELSPQDLSLEPIRADALILLQSKEFILHLEFQTRPKLRVPFRMADYRLRGYRRFPKKRMKQVVIYLKRTNSRRVYQTTFTLEETFHRFQVIRLWEQPSSAFLQSPGLLPFAVLCQSEDRVETKRQVAMEIDNIGDLQTQNNVTASTAILAGLVLEEKVIQQLLRRDLMKESVVYQSIQAEGRTEGRTEGRAEGLQEGIQLMALNMLREGLSIEVVARITGLSVEQVEQLEP